MSQVHVSSLTKLYGRQKLIGIRDVSFSVASGQFVTLLGPSGCGKTTTLRTIAGLEKPDAGSITLGERTLVDAARGSFLRPEQRNLGMVFQSYALWPHLRVYDNVAYPLRVRRIPRDQVDRAVREVLAVVRLEGLGDRYPSQLSGGQQQRVALARAMVGRPQALLFDEPLSNLDAKLRTHMRSELMRLSKDLGWTVVYVTHDQSEALALSDVIVVMHEGRVQQVGTPQEVYRRPANRTVADFIGEATIVAGRVVENRGDLSVVETPFGPTLAQSGKGGPLIEGSSAFIVLRPESLELAAVVRGESPDRVNCWAGRILDATYLGSSLEYRVRLEESDQVVRVQVDSDHALSPGSAVHISVGPDRCIAVGA